MSNILALVADTSPIQAVTAQLTSTAGDVTPAVLIIGGLLVTIAAAVGAAIKWGPSMVNKFFHR